MQYLLAGLDIDMYSAAARPNSSFRDPLFRFLGKASQQSPNLIPALPCTFSGSLCRKHLPWHLCTISAAASRIETLPWT